MLGRAARIIAILAAQFLVDVAGGVLHRLDQAVERGGRAVLAGLRQLARAVARLAAQLVDSIEESALDVFAPAIDGGDGRLGRIAVVAAHSGALNHVIRALGKLFVGGRHFHSPAMTQTRDHSTAAHRAAFHIANTLFVSEAESLPPRLVADTGRAIL